MPRTMDEYRWANLYHHQGDSVNMSGHHSSRWKATTGYTILFGEHFQVDVVYTTTQKYMTNRKEKQLI